MDGADTVPAVDGKALGPDQNERLRDMLREILERDFGGNKSEAARRIGVSQAFVAEFLSGNRGAGNKLLRALADYTGRSTDDLLGRPPPRETRVVYDEARAPKFKFLAWWDEIVAAARKLFPRLPDEAWISFGEVMGENTPPRDPVLFGTIVKAWWEGKQQVVNDPEPTPMEADLKRQAAEQDAIVMERIRRGEPMSGEPKPDAPPPEPPKSSPPGGSKKRRET
jgi:transcriptional regulator with XRE-family HTH domain